MTMIRKFKLYQYSIPVDSQLILRNRFLKKREGLLVQVCCDDAQGWGRLPPYLSLAKKL